MNKANSQFSHLNAYPYFSYAIFMHENSPCMHLEKDASEILQRPPDVHLRKSVDETAEWPSIDFPSEFRMLSPHLLSLHG